MSFSASPRPVNGQFAGPVLEGSAVGTDLKVGIVVSRFNELITESLLEGALATLQRHGVLAQDITVVRVPGACELPLASQKLTKIPGMDAVIALGCVIRGATTHYDYVCQQASAGLQKVSLESEIPVVFGVLTTETIEQAMERAGTKAGNKGSDAAITAIEMATLMPKLSREALEGITV